MFFFHGTLCPQGFRFKNVFILIKLNIVYSKYIQYSSVKGKRFYFISDFVLSHVDLTSLHELGRKLEVGNNTPRLYFSKSI